MVQMVRMPAKNNKKPGDEDELELDPDALDAALIDDEVEEEEDELETEIAKEIEEDF